MFNYTAISYTLLYFSLYILLFIHSYWFKPYSHIKVQPNATSFIWFTPKIQALMTSPSSALQWPYFFFFFFPSTHPILLLLSITLRNMSFSSLDPFRLRTFQHSMGSTNLSLIMESHEEFIKLFESAYIYKYNFSNPVHFLYSFFPLYKWCTL